MAIQYDQFDDSDDVANQSGSYSISDVPVIVDPEFIDNDIQSTDTNGTSQSLSGDIQRQIRWDLNYHEAAIFLQEGENNDKFTTHPRRQKDLPIYLLTHNTGFYILDLSAAVALLLLTIVEKPAVDPLHLHIAIIGSVELLCLIVIGLELGMRCKWLGTQVFFRHVRSVIKLLTLVIMVIETMAVLVRQAHHFRVTRALRPLFLLDTYYCRGVRRIVRQIIQSLPPVLDMLMSLFFFMLIFSIYGFYLFSSVPNDIYFQSIQQSFTSLFVLLTTANFPDVMMPSYNHSSWSCLFFVIYLCLELYLLMNLLLAVVYDAFSNVEKEKLKKLLLHEREACQYAFKLLVSGQHPNKISLRHFFGLMKYYKPRKTHLDIYLTFKTMNGGSAAFLTLDQFYQINSSSKLTWKPHKSPTLWSSNFIHPINKILEGIYWLVSNKYFDFTIYFIIATNFIWVIVDTVLMSVNDTESKQSPLAWYSIMFVAIYVLEVILKNLGFGPVQYFLMNWNIFDFFVTFSAVLGIFLQLVGSNFYYVVILRSLRLMRLFKLRKRLRDVLGTVSILVPQMLSLSIVMILLYFTFAVIGMELFSKYDDMRNCCVNTTVEPYYYYNNLTDTGGYYYLNNFNNILKSSVTLFELTVVNNWYIIMEGFVAVSSEWSRIYFMLFYIVTMVVITVIVAIILEAFLFRIQYRNTMHVESMDDHAQHRVDVGVDCDEVRMCNIPTEAAPNIQCLTQRYCSISEVDSTAQGLTCRDNSMIWYSGERSLDKFDFGIKMYADEVLEWIKEADRMSQQDSAELYEIHNESADMSSTS